MSEEKCCPEFDPEPWNDKIHKWTDKKFIKDSVFTLFHIPVNFGPVIKKLDKKVRTVQGTMPDFLCLSDHTSKWNMDIYLAVDKQIPDAQNVTISGEYYSKVYEGPFKDTGKWCADFESNMKNNNFDVKNLYMWYTTCPKCAKAYNKNYVVIMGKIK